MRWRTFKHLHFLLTCLCEPNPCQAWFSCPRGVVWTQPFSKIKLVVYEERCVTILKTAARETIINAAFWLVELLLGYMLRHTSSEKRRLWKPKQWRLNRVLLAKVVLSRYFWPTSWILLKRLHFSRSHGLWVKKSPHVMGHWPQLCFRLMNPRGFMFLWERARQSQ